MINKALINESLIRSYIRAIVEADDKNAIDISPIVDKIEDELSAIGDEIASMSDDQLAALSKNQLKKYPQLQKIASDETVNEDGSINESAALLTASFAIAIPRIVELIGIVVKRLSKKFGGEGKAGEWLIKKGEKMHHAITSVIKRGLKLIPGLKDLPDEEVEKLAGKIHVAIIATLCVASGASAVIAAAKGAFATAGIEGALAAVKAGERGVVEFLIRSLVEVA